MPKMTKPFRVLVVLVAALFCACEAGDSVPVVLWHGKESTDSALNLVNPLWKTPRAEFEEILKNLTSGQPPIILFLKDSFCIEEFLDHKKALQQLMPGVSLDWIKLTSESIEPVLTSLPQYNSLRTQMTDDIVLKDSELTVVNVTNLNDIPKTYLKAQTSNKNLIAVLTGGSCNIKVKRAVEVPTKQFFVETDRVLLFAEEYPSVKKSPGNFSSLGNSLSNSYSVEDGVILLKMEQFKDGDGLEVNLTMYFLEKSDGYYTLDHIEYQEANHKSFNMTTNEDIVFPFKFSYHCSSNNLFSSKDNNISLIMPGMQVEIDPVNNQFGDAYDCVGFTTVPIWAGIFVTAILALIMIWGISMIMDIRTMDRFDDPKGKTISISAQE